MNRRILLRIALVCIALILVLGIVYSGLRIWESTVFLSNQDFEVSKKTITKNGVDYFPRQDINVILMMGIDQEGPVTASEEPNHGNAVDMIMLMIFDEKTEQYTLLNVNRDTMLDVPMLNEKGHDAGSWYGQLAYSHIYGTGVEDSCENTKRTVSKLFGGINIDYYIAMNVDGVDVLNDAVGGVTVNIVDDFSQIDPDLKMGMFTLRGRQARTFVQSRHNVGEHLNLNRIERQMEYSTRFLETFREKANDSFVLSTYEKIAPYIVSDLPVSTLTGMVTRYQNYELAETLSLEGNNVLGEKYYEFYPDQEKLEELTLQLFYAPK